MRSMLRCAWFIGALAVCTACGEPLAPDVYRGDPITTLPLMISDDGTPTDGPVRVAVFWLPALTQARTLDAWVEDVSTGKTVIRPQRARLALFDTPATLIEFAPGHRAGFGSVFAYQDRNGDGRRQPDEPVIGQLDERIIVYAPTDLAAEASPTGRRLSRGFHTLPRRLPCHLATAAAPPCTLPLGAGCAADAECGGGVCLDEAGFCVLDATGEQACRPTDAVLVIDLPAPDRQPGRYFMPACVDDADCGAARCDRASGRCEPVDALDRVMFRGHPRGPLVCDDPAVHARGFRCGDAANCERRSACFHREFRGKAYLACGSRLTWAEARVFCQTFGGDLVTIDDAEEEGFLQSAGFDGWIGLTDQAEEGVFEWVDGSTSDYRNWGGTVLGNLTRDEDCAVMKRHPRRFWLLDPCDDNKPFLCETAL